MLGLIDHLSYCRPHQPSQALSLHGILIVIFPSAIVCFSYFDSGTGFVVLMKSVQLLISLSLTHAWSYFNGEAEVHCERSPTYSYTARSLAAVNIRQSCFTNANAGHSPINTLPIQFEILKQPHRA